MEFDRINNSNKIIRSGKNIQKKENTPANEVRSEDKIKEFSSDYSSASRALGLSSITFKGNYEQITDARFKERKEKVKKQLEKENLYSEKAIDEILGLVTKENIKVAEIVSKQGCFKDTTIKEFLLNTTKETAKFKNEFATFFDDTIYIILIGNMLKDNDFRCWLLKMRMLFNFLFHG